MEFSKLFCCKYFYIELYRINLEYGSGFKIILDKWILRASVSVLGVTLLIEIGREV